jgi:hypothetical protein
VLKLLKNGKFWVCGVSSTRNADITWVQHFIPSSVLERALSFIKHRTKVV